MTQSVNIDTDNVEKYLGDRLWRLNNLYYIIDENAKKIRFKLNATQCKLYKERWYRNVILKSRQHGITTFVCLLFLDACLFEANKTALIIAHNVQEAIRIFEAKIKFAYDNLPQEIREMVPAKTDRAGELKFNNNSCIYVSTSARARTLNYLHISELGLISLKDPSKAKEIMVGSIPAVHGKNVIFVESTADGGINTKFGDICKTAEEKSKNNTALTELEFKFHFFSWHEDDRNVVNPEGVTISTRFEKYFSELEIRHGVYLSPQQQAWYVITEGILKDEMRVQHPSTSDEAFEAVLEGAYYREQFNIVRKEMRICEVPYQDGALVHTAWDIGINDSTIWFFQLVGKEIHVIDYYENKDADIGHYIDVVKGKKYRYGMHIGPHDLMVREYGNKGLTRFDTAEELGISFLVLPKTNVSDGISLVQQMLSICYFDKDKCLQGITYLENYRREWNSKLGVWRNKPLSNECSHAADAFRYLATYCKQKTTSKNKNIKVGADIENYVYT